ncbi:MAG: hypothetical protein OSB70_10160 [Myxococcota bacterium]|nr:hypothetical protein [Myxococcota bacterium]
MLNLVISVLVAAFAAGSTVAGAHQFEVGLGQDIRVESNMFNSTVNPVTDGVYRVIPLLELSGRLGEFENAKYSLLYNPSYLVYFETQGVNGLDTRAQASLDLQLSPRETLRTMASYTEFSSIRSSSQLNPDGSIDNLADKAGDTVRAFVNLGYSRSVDARSSFNLDADFQDYSFGESTNVGNKSIGTSGSYTHGLSPRLTLGGSLSLRYRLFDAQVTTSGSISSSRTTISNLNLLFFYTFAKDWNFRFQGGPSIIYSQPGTLAGEAAPASATDLTYFMDVSLSKERQKSAYVLRYSRNEDASGGNNGTSVLDSLSAQVSLDLSALWDLDMILGWNFRQSVNSFIYVNPMDPSEILNFTQETSQHQVWGRIGFTRRLGENLTARLGFSYRQIADYEVNGVDQPTQDNYTGSVGINYRFDPYIF